MSWLPRELTIEQPYSMCPLLKHRCVAHLPLGNLELTMPATGGSRLADHPELVIRTMLHPSRRELRALQQSGMAGELRRIIPGLREAFAKGKAA